jgi:outer membrane protein assembly factor BamD (BamD/ComL family)
MKALSFLVAAGMFVLPAAQALAQSTSQLYSEAQRAYLAGDLETAKQKLLIVVEADPGNQGAKNYLRMIRTREKEAGPGNLRQRELEALILPKVNFRDATLDSALEYLKQAAAKASNDKTQVNFVVQLPEETLPKKVTLNLANAPFTEAIKYLGEVASVAFSIDKYAIVVKPKAPSAMAKEASAPEDPAKAQ